ncbi:hypothetical protein ONS95_004960 [Cadophora gregata]|uniref:uncharacterized protein n=1 Tax=Cadophora gregata TaxID=51156 RepID=UPI0026DD30B7|nr:uncharacterized protein ONS95_004960 [Cadophora gregata]KAK0104686.1 hypothetical protein ONS95_004960 [Cadophora gregata]
MPLSESKRTAMREQLENHERYAQKLCAIQVKIRQVERKLVDELTKICTQLQEVVRECSAVEKSFDNITKEWKQPAESQEASGTGVSGESSESETRPRSESSSELESGSGGIYFIIDDMEECDRLLAYLIGEELQDILAAGVAEGAEVAGNSAESSEVN